jgi:chloride channel protein, CIC family
LDPANDDVEYAAMADNLHTVSVPPPDRTAPARTVGPAILWALSLLVGIVAGLGAVAFRALIGIIHNLFFLGRLSAVYDANMHTPAGPWGRFVIIVPVVGAFGVVFLVKNFAPEAKGHGVPEVIQAVYYRKGVIRPVVSVIKALASALSIGSGGSVGREGPIIQIGSSFGSTLGQLLRLPSWQKVTLIAAGAGGGIAATFNTPIGGVLFALEIIMPEFSARTLVPVVTATATATYVGRLFFGQHPSFFIPALELTFFRLTNPVVLLAYAALGAITGLVSALFISSIYGFQHFFEHRVKGGYYVQHAVGMLVVGLMLYVFMSRFGHYYVEGVGYATIQDVLASVQFPLYLLILLFVAKLLATSLTLGSGASGGIFSPALFLGATAGAAYGVVLHQLFPALDIAVPAFAVAGMGGVVAGSTGAAMAAIVMIFEMTLDYTLIIPMTLTVAISYAVRRSVMKDSIYTRKLTLRGELVPESLRGDLQFSRRAASIMNSRLEVFPAATCLQDLSRDGNKACIVADGSDAVVGIVTGESLTAHGNGDSTAVIGDAAQSDFVVVSPQDSVWKVVAAMRSANSSFALVASRGGNVSASSVQGIITRKDIMDILADDMELFGV